VFKDRTFYKTNLFSLAMGTLLLIVISALVGYVALTIVFDNDTAVENNIPLQNSTARPRPEVPAVVQGTPNPLDLVQFKSPALGFSIEYPRVWHKREKGLQVILSPTSAGPDTADLQQASVRFGIPVDNTVEPTELVAEIQAGLLSADQAVTNVRQVKETTTIIDGQSWLSTEVAFEHKVLGGPAVAWMATTSKDQVGYFAVVVAPADQWNTFEPTFQTIVNSFRFTSEAVLRPTDATPPPTPTPTPTPIIYVVQSGDTLLQISLNYGVDVEALADRNGIDDPRRLRTGARLIIPIKRR
jgi:LysM repeat protein